MLPASLLTNSDKSIDDLRDKSLLDQLNMRSTVTLNGSNGRIVLAKKDTVDYQESDRDRSR